MFSHDGKGTLEELCISAVNNRLSGFAVTDHCDCEISDNEAMLENLQNSYLEAEKYQNLYMDRLIISKGIEIGESLFNPSFAEKIIAERDYDVILGSVHAVRIKDHDIPFSLIDFSCFDNEFIESYVTQYFIDLLETANTADYDILSHLTVVLRYIVYKYNRKVELKRYFPVIKEILKTVISRGKTLEVNTSGIENGYFMPDEEIISMYKELGGKRISLGSDSHFPESIGAGLTEGALLLSKLGFTELTYYINRIPYEYKTQGLLQR